ncbi:MAG: YggS family pyridoxal phosphate-dependent enzyme [Chitinophagaceae bacterium]|nr:YggS family pyridoxal phosphate-dependent enzyme [Chitinophagaceae bacterium]
MPVYTNTYLSILHQLRQKDVTLVAVSKTRTAEDIKVLYDLGQRDFGENYVQELLSKHTSLPEDIRWHFIGHLQSNKVRQIAGFVYLIHGVDSVKLLQEINKQGQKINRRIGCLLQVHIAQEETKFGFDAAELSELADQLSSFPFAQVKGLMGMATNTDNEIQVRHEFSRLRELANLLPFEHTPIISMGMSNDYTVAVEEGSTMVRIGSLLFGSRN